MDTIYHGWTQPEPKAKPASRAQIEALIQAVVIMPPTAKSRNVILAAENLLDCCDVLKDEQALTGLVESTS